MISAANIDKREILLEPTSGNGLQTIRDKGYIYSKQMKEELLPEGASPPYQVARQYKDNRPGEAVKT